MNKLLTLRIAIIMDKNRIMNHFDVFLSVFIQHFELTSVPIVSQYKSRLTPYQVLTRA